MTLGPDTPRRPKQPSFRGRVYFYIKDGQEIAAAWPKKRGRIRNPKTADQVEWFRQAQMACKYWPANIYAEIVRATKGTPFMPRDVMTMIMATRLAALDTPDGRTIYPMVARQDISQSLDVLAQVPGSMLYRNEDWWLAIEAPSEPGLVLTWQDIAGGPQWLPTSGTTGPLWYFQPPAAASFPNLLSYDATMPTLADDGDVGLIFSFNGPMVGGTKARVATKPLPAASSWSVTARITPNSPWGDYAAAGIFAVESAAPNRYAAATLTQDVRPIWQHRNDRLSGSFISATGFFNAPTFGWLRLSYTLATDTFKSEASQDGKNWFELASYTRASIGNPTINRIGLGMWTGQANTRVPSLSCDHWSQSF